MEGAGKGSAFWGPLFLLLLFLGGVGRAEDKVWMKGAREPQVGKIVSMDAKNITLEIAGGKGEIALARAQVEKIMMEEPEAFREGKKAFSQKRFAIALMRYGQVTEKFVGSEWAEKAQFAMAECYREQGNEAGARRVYEKLGKEAGDSVLGRKALLALARIDHKEKRYAEAIKAYTAIADSDEGREGAKASKLRGDCYLAQGKFEDALLSYLTVVVLYYREKGLVGHCTFLAGECFEKMGDNERARQYYQEVQDEFKGELRAKARKALARLSAGE